MAVVTITSGSHWRNVNVVNTGVDQFAHVYDPDDPEDHEHQAQNFMTYAAALGPSLAPHVLIAPEPEPDENDQLYIDMQMDAWREIVQSGTGVKVEIT